MGRTAALVLLFAFAAAGCGGGERAPRPAAATPPAPAPRPKPRTPPASAPARPAPPAPHQPIPRSAGPLVRRLASDDAELRRDIDAWLGTRPGRRALPPRRVTLEALYQQRVYRLLGRKPKLASEAIARLPPRLRGEARDSVGALRALFTLTGPATEVRFRAGAPQPPGELRGYYAAAQRRFGVAWSVLAGVNMIESNFGRLRNVSNAGAVGPMQFLPATWRAYGLGGDIHDPHDAILGAANYLRASGAPHSYARALYGYNPSPLYVRAVLRFAHRMRADRLAYFAYWSWQSFMRTPDGDRQLSGPGAIR